jgi:hypothetical protein
MTENSINPATAALDDDGDCGSDAQQAKFIGAQAVAE